MDKLPFEKVERKLIIKKSSSGIFGIEPEKRKTDILINYGVVNVDKPKGPTSHQVSAYVQQILEIKKTGHSGSLDPGVTGVLPTALGDATRIMHLLLKTGKEYAALMHLHKDADEKVIRNVFDKFTGEITQLPPVKSAVKRVERKRKVYYINLLDIDKRDVLFIVGCEAGTYIRKLIHDAGKSLGTGAHMAELRRTKVGLFRENDAVTLQDLADAYYYYKKENNDKFLRYCIKPIEAAVEHLAKIFVLDSTIESLCHGRALAIPGISTFESGIEKGDIAAVMTLKGELIAIGEAMMDEKEITKNSKGIAVKLNKVFMRI